MTHEDQPRLEAWVDTDGENDHLHVVVAEDGTEYERVDTNIEVLLQNERFVDSISRASLTLLSLYDRAIQQQPDTERDEADEMGESAELEAE